MTVIAVTPIYSRPLSLLLLSLGHIMNMIHRRYLSPLLGSSVLSEFGGNFTSIAAMSSEFPEVGDNALGLPGLQIGAASAGDAQPASGSDAEKKGGRPKPKRPLSAYNFFFHSERQNILKDTPTRKEGKPRRSHGKIGFADLARMIAAKWRGISKEDRLIFDEMAAADKERYQREMVEWKRQQSIARSEASNAGSPNQPGGVTSLFNDPLNSNFMRQDASFLRHTFERTLHQFDPTDGEQKMPSSDITMEPYSLTGVFGSYYPQQPSQPTAALREESVQQSTSPRIADLASELDDESTQFFLSLFRPADR